MKRLILLVPVVALLGWYAHNHLDIQGLQDLGLSGDASPTSSESQSPALPPVPEGKTTLRIATFHINPLDEKKMAQPRVLARLVDLIRRFDIVAVQHVLAPNRNLLIRLLNELNAGGRYYTFAIGPAEALSPSAPSSVFLFDRATVEIDPSTITLIEDPGNRIRHSPLVAAFRARGADPTQAFTFTLVNVHTSPDNVAAELELIDDIYETVRNDGRNEDDIIVLGDIGASTYHFDLWRRTLHITRAVANAPSTTRGTALLDNILFDDRATVEYTGRSQVLDVMRELDLSVQEAAEISDHLPVWAEFSVYEGGQAGPVAGLPPAVHR